MHRTGRALANATDWPEWYEGSPFTAIRDESAAERGH